MVTYRSGRSRKRLTFLFSFLTILFPLLFHGATTLNASGVPSTEVDDSAPMEAGTSAEVGVVADVTAGGFPGGHQEALGPKFEATARIEPVARRGAPSGINPLLRLLYWNEIALNANAIDHTPVEDGDERVFGEQIGPHRTARAFAIVHIAMFDAVNAIAGGYEGYTGVGPVHAPAFMCAAIAQAAHDTLVSLYPSQAKTFDMLLEEDLERIPDGRRKTRGIILGQRTASAILKLRAHDGSHHEEPVIGEDFFTRYMPGKWRQDPISMIPIALGAYWGNVEPFVMTSADQYPTQRPPLLRSHEYTEAFYEVKRLGGDGITTPTERTEEQTIAGIFWSYDGTPGLGTPPRLYNQIAVQIAEQQGSDVVETARLLALLNVGMADTAISCWNTKYSYQFWRPVTGIREADPGTGPTGLGDGNPATIGDPTFTPLGSQSSNLIGPNFTPPFPAYSSGHAAFGGVLFQILRRFYETDDIAFTFISDEFNGITTDNTGAVRPRIPRTFSSLSEAEEENGQSRIYLGLHWKFDKTKGIAHGNEIGDYIMEHVFKPQGSPSNQ